MSLSVENLVLDHGASRTLRQVSLHAAAGEVTAVLGRNGVGKTSLMRAITGLAPIAGGRVLLDGEDISRLAPYARARRGLAYVPQGRDIFPLLTVRENLQTGFALLGRGERHIPNEVFDLFPVLATMLARRGGDLSGGQQQQLAIGRALVTRPRFLLMDEPTEGIQPSVIKDIGRAIRYLRTQRGIGIVLVEQYFDFARDLCDRYAVIERGEVVLGGRCEDMDAQRVRALMSV